jgi:bacterial/archaeal transporter family protein
MLAFVFSFLALISLAVGWFFAARSSKDMNPLVSTFLFQLVGVPMFLVLLPFAPAGINENIIIPILLIGIFETLVMLLLFKAMKEGDVSVVLPITDGYAVITAIIGVLFLKEILTTGNYIGMFLIFLGITLISTKISKGNLSKILEMKKGVTPALLAALGNGIFFVLVGLAARNSNWFVTALGIRIAISLTAFVILIVKRYDFKKIRQGVSWKWLLPAAFLDILGFSFYNMAVSISQVSYATLMISAQSLVIVLLGFFVLKEKVDRNQWIGVFATLVGLIILQIK